MRILILIFSLSIISCQSDSIDDSSKRNENWEWWEDLTSGKGKWRFITNSGNNSESGKYTQFFSNGAIRTKGTLINGKNIDTTYFYDLKEKWTQYIVHTADSEFQFFVNDGYNKRYYPNCKIREEGMVKNLTYFYPWTIYYENGKMKMQSKLINSTAIQITYYETGQVKDSSCFINHIQNGGYKLWYINGSIKEIGNCKFGKRDSKTITYYDNGQIQIISNYNNGIRNGGYLSYYENGQIKRKSFLIDGMSEGKVIEYYENGQIHIIVNYHNNIRNGEYKLYYENGHLKTKVFYKNGEKVGKQISYLSDGKIKSKE